VRGAIAITSAFVVVGCSIGALEGFSGGAGDVDASLADGPTIADVTTTTDAISPNEDAAADAGMDADSSGDAMPFSCSAAYLLCTTFDNGPFTTGWDGNKMQSGGTLVLDNVARSAPYSLLAQVPPQTSTTDQYARLAKVFSGTRSLRIAFDVNIATPVGTTASDKAIALLEINFLGSGNSTYLFREYAATTLSTEQTSKYNIVEVLPYGQWVRVTVEIVPTSPTGSLKLFYDGRSVFANTAQAFNAPGTSTEVYVGIVRYDAPAPAMSIRYDNVTIEQIP
jgi:hypothetical protein